MINWPVNRNPKNNPFVLVSTDFGTMIVNRFDYKNTETGTFGVGHNLLTHSVFDPAEINLVMQILELLRSYRGDNVVMLDGGANIGVHTLSAARLMYGWGNVISIEAQERLYYALAGNITINNLSNARAIWAALSDTAGSITVPVPDYTTPSSFGSLELIQSETSEDIGQNVTLLSQIIPAITIDSLNLDRLDYLKLDVENMELIVIAGAIETIKRCNPIVQIEVLKTDRNLIEAKMTELGYEILDMDHGYNFLCVPAQDPVRMHLTPNNVAQNV